MVPKYQVATEVPLRSTASVGQKTLLVVLRPDHDLRAPGARREAPRHQVEAPAAAAVRLRQISVTLPAGSVRTAGIGH